MNPSLVRTMQRPFKTARLAHKRNWIFDIDGTLTDLTTQPDFELIRKELGLATSENILEALDKLPEPVFSEKHKRLEELEAESIPHTTRAGGVQDLLTHLKSKGCNVGILTRNTRTNAVLTLDALGLAHFFESNHVLGRENAAPKPDPAGIIKLLEMWGQMDNKAETVMVGDYHYDLEAGVNAGVGTIHIAAHKHNFSSISDHECQGLDALLQSIQSETS